MLDQVKLRQGQKINLVQVMGNASTSGYMDIDLYFHKPDGQVKINVEAYVVKGMSTPFILGNDFTDQYSILVIWKERMPVNNSVSPPFIDEEGQALLTLFMSSSLSASLVVLDLVTGHSLRWLVALKTAV